MPNAAETVEAPYTAAERLTFLPQPASATAIEVNGLHVILLLLVPILLTAITLLGLRLQQTTMRKILLWSPAVVLLGFCFVAIASIGMFYLPTALALLVAAIADLGGQEGNEPI